MSGLGASAFGLTAVVTAALTGGLIRWQARIRIVDVPNARSSHKAPTPRTGGIAIVLGMLAGALVFAGRGGSNVPHAAWLAGGAALFFGLGLLEDLRPSSEMLRLAVQTAFCAAMAVWGPRLDVLALPGLTLRLPPPAAVAVTVFWLVGFINLFNFMDGIDGIAAGEAVLAGLFIALLSHASWPLLISAAALGFLAFNWQPARIFMGDAGSYPVGFLLAAACVMGGASAPFPAYVLILGTFVADTSATLARRMLRGEPWLKAHRSHYYQKLTDLGFSHWQVAGGNLLLTALLGASAIVYPRLGAGWQACLLVAWLAALGGMMGAIHLAERRRARTPVETSERSAVGAER